MTDEKPKRPAHSTRTLRDIGRLQESLLKLKALKDSVKDKRKLVPEAVEVLVGDDDPLPGEHTSAIYRRLVRFVELEIEAEWAPIWNASAKSRIGATGTLQRLGRMRRPDRRPATKPR